MEDKNYLKESLSKEEKSDLKRIIMTARNKFFEKNYAVINYRNASIDDTVIKDEISMVDVIIEKYQDDIESAMEFERVFSNPKLYRIVKALSLKEKEVLFYLYKEQKSLTETSRIMKVSLSTIIRLRDKAHSKIIINLLKEEFWDV